MLDLNTWEDEDRVYFRQLDLKIKRMKIYMILFIVAVCILFFKLAHAEPLQIKQEFVAGYSLDAWADAIRKTEGNPNYGILSIDCKLSEARRICKNTVRNNWKRYKAHAGDMSDFDSFLSFLANRYCPKSVDPIGNTNWQHNTKYFLKKSLEN